MAVEHSNSCLNIRGISLRHSPSSESIYQLELRSSAVDLENIYSVFSPSDSSSRAHASSDNVPSRGSPSQRVFSVVESTAEARDNEQVATACIFARLLIPGRGNPIPDAAVIVRETSILFAGPASELPPLGPLVQRLKVQYLLPGLWDCHAHFSGTLHVDFPDMVQTNPVVCGASIVRSFYDILMAGFTSVREVGGFGLEASKAVNAGLILGPNVYGAGAAIGITGGSCDAVTLPADYVYSRQSSDHNNAWTGCCMLALADGVEEIRRTVRQQIRRGAQCIKVVASGGVLSTNDDLHARQYSDEELRVLVEEARLARRAVAAHAHGKDAIIAAVRAGATTIEHGSYIDDEVADLMRERNTALVATRTVVEINMKHLDRLNPETAQKFREVSRQHKLAYATAIRKKVKIALGTDVVSSDPRQPSHHGLQGQELVYAVDAGLSPLQAIEAATANAAETLGPQAPKKGLIKSGWDADMIALDHNPLQNMRLFANPDNIKYVWKSGDLVKAPGKSFWPPKLQ